MSSPTPDVGRLTTFYAAMTPSLDTIRGLLAASGVDPSAVRAPDLYERDLDCHNIGVHAMLEQIASVMAEYGAPTEDQVVLDIGCGLGGPGRFLVERFACSVVGIDALALRTKLAEELSDLTGMSERISYRVADATRTKLPERSFSHAWMLDVGVHIRDKAALFGEIARVLEPDGLLVMHDQLGPLPKSMAPVRRRAPYYAPSFLQLVRYIENAGLRLLTWRDTTDRAVEYFRALRAVLDAAGPATSPAEQRQRNRGAAVLTAYLETLSGPDGRTGTLVARKRE